MWLGAHIGIADGLAEAPRTGRRIGCEAIQIFSKSPQMWAGPPIAPEAANGFRAAVQEVGLKASAVHHGYLVNLASPKKPMLARSRTTFLDEIRRAEMLGVDHLIFHPGAHLESGREEGIRVLVESLNAAFAATAGAHVRVLLENSAGQGTSIGSTFVDLADVLGKLEDRGRAGVTIDTCHLFASGVDFRTPELYEAAMERLERELGAGEVRAFHLNDAKAELGSHLDRHENIGKGQIGTEGFRSLVNDPRWASIPGYLETPLAGDDYSAYSTDLATLRGLLAGASKPPAARRKPKRAAAAAND
ncbi:MAG: deoxyribonuclease IV [Thermoplasmata archaeon]|nr:deoxyribonuclease IV [Thermoplasmata archaeon]MCI4354197.1 deoxyribonuclease IV [Thermoplasmata archaeon]